MPSGYAPVASARHAENPHLIPQNPQLIAKIRMSLPADGTANADLSPLSNRLNESVEKPKGHVLDDLISHAKAASRTEIGPPMRPLRPFPTDSTVT